MSERKPVFYDEEQRRWRRTRRVLELAGVLFTVVLVTFFITIAQRVDLPGLLLPSGRTGLHAVLASANTSASISGESASGGGPSARSLPA